MVIKLVGMMFMSNHIVDEAIEEMKQANIRITPQRFAILEFLVESKKSSNSR